MTRSESAFDSHSKSQYSSQNGYAVYMVAYEGILYYELLEPKQTVNATLYSQQLMYLNEKILENRTGPGHGNKKVILLHDNARPHVALITKKTIMELGWEVLPHPAYSPDLAPSDYHIFRSIELFLREKSFSNHEELKKRA